MEEKKGHFPLFINMEDKNIVIVGAGKIALRRAETLIQFPCNLIVVAPEINESIQSYNKEGLLSVKKQEFQPEDVEGAYIVIAATNNETINDSIYEICKEKNILVNHAGNKDKCDFYFPGIIKKEEVVIGVTASGSDHKLAKRITELIRKVLKTQLEIK